MSPPSKAAPVAGEPAAQGPSWVTALMTMVAVQMATAFLSRVPPTLAPALAAERGWSDAMVGYLSSLITLGSILFLVLGAPFLHRLGSVRALQRGLVFGFMLAACFGVACMAIKRGPLQAQPNDSLR